MRILLSQESKKKLQSLLLAHYNVKTRHQPSAKINVSLGTLEKWFYNKEMYISENAIPAELIHHFDILDKQDDNWGRIKGGQKTHQIILHKYGKQELQRRQIAGGTASAFQREEKATKDFKIDKESPEFLELCGALLGDGWLSALHYPNKQKKHIWLAGISGHSILDEKYHLYLKQLIKEILGREASLKYKKDLNGIELLLFHKQFVLFMSQNFSFPIGPKEDLQIEEAVAKNWQKIKPVMRGIFDTDGCFYLDNKSGKKPYPCIAITMHSPVLLKQMRTQLLAHGFKTFITKNKLVLKGSIQINKWMSEIGSSNQRHFIKYQKFKQQAPVVQPG